MKMEPKKFEIDLNPEVATGKYSNLALITHSDSEFVLDFIENMPGMPKAQVVSRVVMTPVHAKRLLLALKDNVAKYEAVNGTIKLPEPPAAIPPLGSSAEA